MRKTKRVMAVVLAATMVLGSSLTAFAEDAVTSGGTNGEGTSEGHVNKHVISVTLPVIAEGATPFAYTMDPERLVNETNAAKYAEGSTFTDTAKTNGVYFQTGEKAYDDKSTVLKAKSESSADVKLTVDVEVESAATDIELVDAAPALTGEDMVTDPQLYLALKVDDTTKAVKSTEKVSIETTIEGKDSNFETVVESNNYVYKAKTGDSITWNEAEIQMSGVASKASAEGLTAPTLKVTWKYEDPAETPATPSIALSGTYSRANDAIEFNISNVGDLTIDGIKGYLADGETEISGSFASGSWSINAAKTKLVINGTTAPFGAGAVGQTRGIGLVLSDGSIIKTTFTVAE